jgi:chromosome segregation ATPase
LSKALKNGIILCPNCRKRSKSAIKLFVSKIPKGRPQTSDSETEEVEVADKKKEIMIEIEPTLQGEYNDEGLLEHLQNQIIIFNNEIERLTDELDRADINAEEDASTIQYLADQLASQKYQVVLLKEENKERIQELESQLKTILAREERLRKELMNMSVISNKEKNLNIQLHNQMNQMRSEVVKAHKEISDYNLVNSELRNELEKMRDIRFTSE